MSIDEMQDALNKKYARRTKRCGIKIVIPEHIKKIRQLERIADGYKMDNR